MGQRPVSQSNKSSNGIKKTWIIVSSIITTAVVGGGVYMWQSSSLKSIVLLRNQIQQPQQQNIEIPDSKTQLPTDQQDAATNGKSMKIADKTSLYSIDIPNDWKVTINEGTMGVQVSRILAESPDWSHHSDETYEGPFIPQYYTSGGSLQLHVTQGESEPSHNGEGGGPETGVITRKNVTVDGDDGIYHVFKEPSTFEGQMIDVHINHEGNNYVLRLTYNPVNFNGKEFFDTLLDSFTFLQ